MLHTCFRHIFWAVLAKTAALHRLHMFVYSIIFKRIGNYFRNDIDILLAKNRSSCSTQTAFKHRITASISEYNPRAISSFVLVGK